MSNVNLRYKFIRSLYRGGLGATYLMDDTIMNQRCIIKFIKKEQFNENEINIMKRIKNNTCKPDLICLRDYFDYKNYVAIVSDYIKGETLEKIPLTFFNKNAFVWVFKKSLDALYHLHDELNIAHLDIKPSNIMVVNEPDNYNLAIIDFGACCLNVSGCKAITWTYGFIPPSFFNFINTGQLFTLDYGKSYDVFSLGITMYNLLFRENPLVNINNQTDYNNAVLNIINKLRINDPVLLQNFTNFYSNIPLEEAKKIITSFKSVLISMLNPVDTERISIKTLLNDINIYLDTRPQIKNTFNKYDDNVKIKQQSINLTYITKQNQTKNGILFEYTDDRIKDTNNKIISEEYNDVITKVVI